jgi:hypothetical protein
MKYGADLATSPSSVLNNVGIIFLKFIIKLKHLGNQLGHVFGNVGFKPSMIVV